MPNWPPSSSCVMPSTVTGTTPYHHNDSKRLFMHNPLLDRLGAWTVVLRPDQLHSEPACRVPLISEDGEFLVLLLQIGPISAESTPQGRRDLGAQIPGHERGRQKSRTHRNCRTCLGLSQGQGRMARGR